MEFSMIKQSFQLSYLNAEPKVFIVERVDIHYDCYSLDFRVFREIFQKM